MKQAAKQRLSDLRPNTTIQCLLCEQPKPEAGAQKFRAHKVCADCVRRLQTKET